MAVVCAPGAGPPAKCQSEVGRTVEQVTRGNAAGRSTTGNTGTNGRGRTGHQQGQHGECTPRGDSGLHDGPCFCGPRACDRIGRATVTIGSRFQAALSVEGHGQACISVL